MDSLFRSVAEVHRRAQDDNRSISQDWYECYERTKHCNAVAALCSKDVWEHGKTEGTLTGVPILVKDNFNVRGMPTTAGSLHMPSNPQQSDAPAVARLRAQGAVVVGKSTLSELSGFVSTHLPQGFSERYGQTLNSVFPETSPGGSSSGSACAVACGLVPLALGTETNGSIMIPAMRHHIIGFKPTHGRVSCRGVVPISRHFDTVGVLANTCEDVETFFEICADRWELSNERKVCRIGVVCDANQAESEQLSALKRAAQIESIELVLVKMPTPYEHYKTVCSMDIQEDMTAWLREYGDGSVEDFSALVQAYRNHKHPYGMDRLDYADHFVGSSAQEAYCEALRAREELIAQMDATFEANAIDAVVLFSYDCNWTMAGLPQITVPWVGCRNMFIGMRHGQDERLIRLAERLLSHCCMS